MTKIVGSDVWHTEKVPSHSVKPLTDSTRKNEFHWCGECRDWFEPSPPNTAGLRPEDYRDAMIVHTTVNSSGVIRTLSEVMPRIWVEARNQGKGTHWVNTHPIVQLYLLHLADMADIQSFSYCNEAYVKAQEFCQKQIQAVEVVNAE